MQNLKYYLKKAKKEKWAIGQFNFSTLDQLRGILVASENMKSPVILGTSEGESRYLGLETISFLAKNAKNAFLNLDHGKNLDWIKEAVKCGYSAVHFDGSKLSFSENIRITKKVVGYASKKKVLTEGEIGVISGDSSVHKEILVVNKESLTDPEQAEEFVKKTKVDSLAIAIGSAHGVYAGLPSLDFERLEKIASLTDAFLVLHGGSGIDEQQLKKAISLGIVKINVNTEIRSAWAEEISLRIKEGEQKPYNVLEFAQKAVQKKVEEKIKIFGSFNKI